LPTYAVISGICSPVELSSPERPARHPIVTGLVVREAVPDRIRAESNFLVVETQNDMLPRVFAVGRSYDEIPPVGDSFRFKTRRCVYTSNLIPNTLIIPF